MWRTPYFPSGPLSFEYTARKSHILSFGGDCSNLNGKDQDYIYPFVANLSPWKHILFAHFNSDGGDSPVSFTMVATNSVGSSWIMSQKKRIKESCVSFAEELDRCNVMTHFHAAKPLVPTEMIMG